MECPFCTIEAACSIETAAQINDLSILVQGKTVIDKLDQVDKTLFREFQRNDFAAGKMCCRSCLERNDMKNRVRRPKCGSDTQPKGYLLRLIIGCVAPSYLQISGIFKIVKCVQIRVGIFFGYDNTGMPSIGINDIDRFVTGSIRIRRSTTTCRGQASTRWKSGTPSTGGARILSTGFLWVRSRS